MFCNEQRSIAQNPMKSEHEHILEYKLLGILRITLNLTEIYMQQFTSAQELLIEKAMRHYPALNPFTIVIEGIPCTLHEMHHPVQSPYAKYVLPISIRNDLVVFTLEFGFNEIWFLCYWELDSTNKVIHGNMGESSARSKTEFIGEVTIAVKARLNDNQIDLRWRP